MIPDRDDFWLAAPPSKRACPSPPPSNIIATSAAATVQSRSVTATTAAASGVNKNQLLHSRSSDGNSNADKNKPSEMHRQPLTAWKQYCYFIESMESRGQKFDQKMLLEAMFRGGNLVYSAAAVDCQAS